MKSPNGDIRPEWFYSNDEGKTKLNWFTYEVALEFRTFLRHSPKLRGFLKSKGEKSIAKFCFNYALRMKQIVIDQLAENGNSAISDEEYFAGYYPDLTMSQINLLAKAADDAWDRHLSVCEVCPVRCLSEKDLMSDMFESWEDFS